jgi:hypothetical protein
MHEFGVILSILPQNEHIIEQLYPSQTFISRIYQFILIMLVNVGENTFHVTKHFILVHIDASVQKSVFCEFFLEYTENAVIVCVKCDT